MVVGNHEAATPLPFSPQMWSILMRSDKTQHKDGIRQYDAYITLDINGGTGGSGQHL